MPQKIIAVVDDQKSSKVVVVGASYYNETGFLSALAVLPGHRGRGIGRLLIAATLGDMKNRLGCRGSHLHVLSSDASDETHGLYTSCGYRGGSPRAGGDYAMSAIPDHVEERVLGAGRPH